MKKVTIIFVILLLIVLAVTLKDSFSVNIVPKSTGTPNNITSSAQSKNSSFETKENTEGPVSVTVKPLSLENGLPTWDFEITLNTHSEELNADLVTVSELVDDQGKLYKPISWEGDKPGGHHRSGILKFNPISPKPKSLELKMSKLFPSETKNVGGVTERSFKWNL